MSDVRLLAFYLPQFHPIAENDDWWGRGFTEWTNVTKAQPLFDGHYQPRLPANLGFYDLRVPEVRRRQAELARAAGIDGFCYWHYWFEGRRLLERPFEEVLASGDPDFPFCLAWANETWSRRWLGEERDVLLAQTYSHEDDVRHIRWLIRAFRDDRYFRVGDRPVFLVYRPADLPDPRRTLDVWRSECARARVPDPYLVGVNSHVERDWREVGFDANLAFEPQLGAVCSTLDGGTQVFDYRDARAAMTARSTGLAAHRCVFVSWDNTARRGENAVVFTGADPAAFEEALRETIASLPPGPPEERVVFVNAWNEWAEGNHLEPDQRYGLEWLNGVRRAVEATAAASSEAASR